MEMVQPGKEKEIQTNDGHDLFSYRGCVPD